VVKIKIDTSEFDELLLDVLIQALGNKEGSFEMDNMCLSVYEEACDYLTEKGYLVTDNGRIYRMKPKVNQSHNNQQNKPCEVSGNSSQP